MPDRVKEAVFNILAADYGTPGALPAVHVADVFAGSGSMGLEALSRGAAHCCFYERHPEALEALRRNLQNLDVGSEAAVIPVDAWRRAVRCPLGRPFDLVFLDPPYRNSQDTSETGDVGRYLRRLAGTAECQPLVVLHHSAHVEYPAQIAGAWRVVDARVIGSSAVTFFGGHETQKA